MTLKISSQAFIHNNEIPKQYTCDGQDISPQLSWHDYPKETQSFVLIVDDPDAPSGTWDHWLLFNIPPNANELKEKIASLPAGTKAGKNSWRRNDYGGPCPPDTEHRYFFKLYALDKGLDLPEGASKYQIETAMMGHILAETALMGRYERE